MNHDFIQATIYALATPPGRSGVAVIRVSGPGAAHSLRTLAGGLPEPRQAGLRTLRDPISQTILDRALILYFNAPHSYTGEDVAEYHVHGGRAVIDGVMDALRTMPNHRLAEPGEFTRLAFENGKLDLTEAEAVADLIDAETHHQREQALQQMGGALATLYAGWADRLATLLAHAEADIDFPDEDLPEGLNESLHPQLDALLTELNAHLDDNRRGERLRDGIRIAVIGSPNAGKSSLVNALSRRDVAIVSDIAGTTRDVIEAHLQIDGWPVIIADTAGLRPIDVNNDAQARIEGEGIRRAREQARAADIKLLVFDAALLPEKDEATAALIDADSIVLYNKADLVTAYATDGLYVSAVSSQGLDALTARLGAMIAARMGDRHDAPLTRQRHRAALEEARDSLIRARSAPLAELAAEDLRLALRAIGRITGRVDVEDLLDKIFRDFCIGK